MSRRPHRVVAHLRRLPTGGHVVVPQHVRENSGRGPLPHAPFAVLPFAVERVPEAPVDLGPLWTDRGGE